jgi:hypothetical protein
VLAGAVRLYERANPQKQMVVYILGEFRVASFAARHRHPNYQQDRYSERKVQMQATWGHLVSSARAHHNLSVEFCIRDAKLPPAALFSFNFDYRPKVGSALEHATNQLTLYEELIKPEALYDTSHLWAEELERGAAALRYVAHGAPVTMELAVMIVLQASRRGLILARIQECFKRSGVQFTPNTQPKRLLVNALVNDCFTKTDGQTNGWGTIYSYHP